MLGFIGARACFAAGTRVVTEINPNGEVISKNIEDLHIGDFIISRSEFDPSATLERRQILSRMVASSDHLRILQIQAVNGSIETLRTTDGHPFWVIGAGWKKADDLEVGQYLAGLRGEVLLVVDSIREEHREQVITYNFEIEGGTPTLSMMAKARRLRCGCIMRPVWPMARRSLRAEGVRSMSCSSI